MIILKRKEMIMNHLPVRYIYIRNFFTMTLNLTIVVAIRGLYFTINFTFFLGARPQLNIIFVIAKKDNVGRLGTFF